MPKHLSEFDRGQIIGAHHFGASYQQIADMIGCHRDTIRRVVKKFHSTGEYKRVKGSGRPKNWSNRSARALRRSFQRGQFKTAMDVERSTATSSTFRRSSETIRRMLRSQGLFGRVASRKPLISRQNRLKRLKFALDHRHCTVDDWKKVLYTDETRVKRFGSDGRQYIWRQRNEPLSFRTATPTVKADRADFMAWSCFGWNGVGWIAKIFGSMDTDRYLEVLGDDCARSIQHCLEENAWEDFELLQDNAPCHKSTAVIDYFDFIGWKVMNFPPQSPDLNPIENLWQIAKSSFTKR